MASVNDKKSLEAMTGKPPMQQMSNNMLHTGFDNATLGTLNSQGQAPSRWSINIQEIVKRTQKNLERGSSSQNRNVERKIGGMSKDSESGDIQYLNKNIKLSFGSSTAKDKSSLLYHDLKKKLSYETHPTGAAASTEAVGSGNWRKENLLSLTGQSSAKLMTRPMASTNNNQSNAGLYLGNQKSTTLSEKYGIQRIKRRSHDADVAHAADNQQNYAASNIIAMHNNSAAGAIQGTQGGGEIYHQDNAQYQQMYQQNIIHRSVEDRQMAHQRTLMQAGRLNQIGQSVDNNFNNNEPDEEATLIKNGSINRRQNIEFRRHNSNLVKSNALNLEIQDQQQVQELQRALNETNAIVEAATNDESTHRHGAHSYERTRHNDGGPLTTNNLMGEGSSGTIKLKQLRMPTSVGNANQIGMLTETHIKRAAVDLKKCGHTRAGNTQSNIEHRQKIFEEEIIKRIKEIQRYVKSLHLQIKKTQSGQEKIKEEIESDKDVLISLQQSVEMSNKKYMQDKLKNVTSADFESSFKELENMTSQKLIKVVTDATDQVLQQVRDEIVPEARLKMYDSITEETNRLKHDLSYQIQAVKREQSDATKNDRLKNNEIIRKEVKGLRDELQSEQSSQTLQILAQVDSQIAKAIKESRQSEVPRAELLQLKSDLLDKVYAAEQKFQEELQAETVRLESQSMKPLEKRLQELQNRGLNDLLNSKLKSISSKFVVPDMLTERLTAMREETTLEMQGEIQKITDQNKALFISTDKFSNELLKVKRDFSKQVKTAQEEAKFDALQMLQADMVEFTNLQKDFNFKVQEVQKGLQEIRQKSEETIQRVASKEKDSMSMKKQSSQQQEQLGQLENRISNLSADLTELQARQESANKAQKLDSHRSTQEITQNAAVMDEIDSMRDDLKKTSDHCNSVERDLGQLRQKLTQSLKSLSNEKQLTNLTSQLDEVQKQVVDAQFEAGRNKKFLEDQLTELSCNTEGLQARLITCEQAQNQEADKVSKEVEVLHRNNEKKQSEIQSETRKAIEQRCAELQKKLEAMAKENTKRIDELQSGMSVMIEEQQLKVAKSTAEHLRSQTVHTTEASASKDEQILLQQQEALDELSEKLSDQMMKFGVLQTRIDSLEDKSNNRGVVNDINSLQMMLSTISERNGDLENQIRACEDKIRACQDAQKQANVAQDQKAKNTTSESGKIKEWCETALAKTKKDVDDANEKILQLRREDQVNNEVLKASVERVKLDMDAKIDALEKELQTRLQQQSAVITQKVQSGPTWQESSIKKLEPKKASGWNEVRATKIESKDQLASLQSSQVALSSSVRTSNLKSMPPPRHDTEQVPYFEKQQSQDTADDIIGDSTHGLSKQSLHINAEEPKQQLLGNYRQAVEIDNMDASLNSVIRTTDDEKQKLEKSIRQNSELDDREKSKKRQLDKEPVKIEDAIKEKSQGQNWDHSSQDEQFQCLSNDLVKSLRKPTEYSASVDHQQQPTAGPEHVQRNESELEFKSPVQFEMVAESDVKVKETNSSQSNLHLEYQMAYDDVNNLNDQIVSPSEVQVPNGDFYKLQREIHSNQVHKKTDMAIRVECDQAIESQKVDSPKPLDADDFRDNDEEEHQQDELQDNEEGDQFMDEDGDYDEEKLLQDDEMEASGNSILLKKSKTPKLGDLNLDGSKAGSSQLFCTQKMAGLAMLSQNATKKHLEGLDEDQSLVDDDLEHLQNDGSESKDDDLRKLVMGASAAESESGGLDEIPASMAVLGMKFGGHQRKNSDGKSSMMGLSALGLESHRDSSQLDQPNNQCLLPDQLDDVQKHLQLLNQRGDSQEAEEEAASNNELGDIDLEVDLAGSSAEKEGQDSERIEQILEMFMVDEIEQALQIMIDLENPNLVCEEEDYDDEQ